MSKEAWIINESELDDYQVPIIQKKITQSFIVEGCAGSGKTVLALWKAREIFEAKLGSFYFVVYTKALRQFINDGVEVAGIPSDRVLHHYQWRKLSNSRADYIIVDEVQDFSREELTELQQSANKALILFGDSAQQVYYGLKANLMSMREISYHTKLPMQPLILNHRLPKKLARVAEYLNSTGDNLEGICKKEGANKPFLVKAGSWKDQLDFIKATIKERDYTDVGILFPDNKLVKQADDYFKEINLRVEAKYDISWPDNTKFNLNFHSDNPKLLTYHSAKGLQFEAVFIPHCSFNTRTSSMGALYVALTRTYQDLFIIYSQNLTTYLDPVPKQLFEVVNLNGYKTTAISPMEEEDDLPF